MDILNTYYITQSNDTLINNYKKYFKNDNITKEDKKNMDLLDMINDGYYEQDKLKKFNSLELLEKENELILLIKNIQKNRELNFHTFIKCLEALLNISEILRSRTGKNKIIIDHTKNDNVKRCSYKFCTFNSNCSFFYSSDKRCYQDHFVHHMVSLDIENFIIYIKENFDLDSSILINKELLKTISTLKYVITHMYNELNEKCMYMKPHQIEKIHSKK